MQANDIEEESGEEEEHPIKNGIFRAFPDKGIIAPYEMVEVTWTFRPKELIQYTDVWKCIVHVQRGRIEPKEVLPYFEFTFPVTGFAESCQVEVRLFLILKFMSPIIDFILRQHHQLSILDW